MDPPGGKLIARSLTFSSSNGAAWNSKDNFYNGPAGDSHGRNVQTPVNKIRRLLCYQIMCPDGALNTILQAYVRDNDGNPAYFHAHQTAAGWQVGTVDGMPKVQKAVLTDGGTTIPDVWMPAGYYPYLAAGAILSVGGGQAEFRGMFMAIEWNIDRHGRPVEWTP